MSRAKVLTALVVLVSALTLVQQGVSAEFQSTVTATVAISTGTTGASLVSVTHGDPVCPPTDIFVCTAASALSETHLSVAATMATDRSAYQVTYSLHIENTGTLPISVSLTGSGNNTNPMGTAMTVSSAGNPDISLADFTSLTQLTLPDHLAGGASVDYDLTFSAPSFSLIFCEDCPESGAVTQQVDVQVTMSWVEASSTNTVPH
jgi:hypothetical protein